MAYETDRWVREHNVFFSRQGLIELPRLLDYWNEVHLWHRMKHESNMAALSIEPRSTDIGAEYANTKLLYQAGYWPW